MSWGTLGKSTFQGERIGNSMTKALREKGKVPKRYDKKSQIQNRKQLTKEGVVSFWRLIKDVIGK